MADASFTGRERTRRTPRRVRTAETFARFSITAGGVGTILAVVMIFVFLLWVVFPLFQGSQVERLPRVALSSPLPQAAVRGGGIDESGLQAWVLYADGRLEVRALNDGRLLLDRSLFGGLVPTAYAVSPDGPEVAFGFADGTVRRGKIDFETTYLGKAAVSEEARQLRVGSSARHELGIVQFTPERQWRYDCLQVELSEPIRIASTAIELLDYSITSSGSAFGFLTADGRLGISGVEESHNFLTDEVEQEITERTLLYQPQEAWGPPAYLRLSGVGNTLYLIWKSGRLLRFDAREEVLAQGLKMDVVERVQLVPDGLTVEKVHSMCGKTTLLVVDSTGTISAWFPTRPGDAFARDGSALARGHVLPGPGGRKLEHIAASRRSRLIAAGYEGGVVRLLQVTNERLLAETTSERDASLDALFLAPKEDGLVALQGGAIQRWRVDPGHPEGGAAALFTKVWYEGAVEPKHVWQSDGASDDFEPKLGLVPLIFGTLKATLYSILIAAPIALLAALFTSEFLNPRWRSPIKSAVEMMAGLPSVVLGFLAAIVIAPFVKDVLPITLCALFTLPLTILFCARLWQLLPTATAVRLAGMPRFLAMALTLPLAIGLAALLSPLVIGWCFDGDIARWLNGEIGEAAGGWAFMLFPLSLLLVIGLVSWFAGPWLQRRSMGWGRLGCAAFDLLKFVAVLGLSVLVTWGLGQALGGTDPRESLIGRYDPRNAMIVGFVMGFAIVPIIYTLAEDALSSVPNELREGSLGCGATQWQTAWRIVLPTAMSGLFSALMVGLGRAVGETMIVLMAAGNTPIMDWNPFNGFRTLSANIATELPEAVRDSTHYRVLFMAGLVLFAITFVLNTAAEMVRRRFRQRFAQL